MSQIRRRRLTGVCFAIYCAALFCILFLRTDYGYVDLSRYPYWDRVLDKLNLIPFSSIGGQIRSIFGRGSYTRLVAIRNLAANMLIFVPMGLLLPMLWEKLRRFRASFTLWCGMILGIELAQLLTLQGSFDVDDVILNTLGFVCGYGFFMILRCLFRKEK